MSLSKKFYTILTLILFSYFIAPAQEKVDSIKTVNSLLNKPMPAFSETSLTGIKWNNESLKGKVAVINFWYIGCPPCMTEIDHFNELYSDYKNNDEFVLISVAPHVKEDLIAFNDTNSDDQYSILKDIFNASTIQYEIIPACKKRKRTNIKIEGNETSITVGPECDAIARDFFIRGYPTTLIVDKNGIIRHIQVGFAVKMKESPSSKVRFTKPDGPPAEEVPEETPEGTSTKVNTVRSVGSNIFDEYRKILDELLGK